VDTHGGSWLLDPTDLIVDSTAAGAIDTALVSGDVTIATAPPATRPAPSARPATPRPAPATSSSSRP